METTKAESVALSFLAHWVLFYGPYIWLLSEIGKLLNAKFFQDVFPLPGTENLFTIPYHRTSETLQQKYPRNAR